MFYAGIGSRKTPRPILSKMMVIGAILARKGYTLRSGGAEGADKAFEQGCIAVRGDMRIYYPEPNNLELWWLDTAEKFHPAWDRCTEYAQRLHARNTPIILGPDEWPFRPSDFVVCWTPGGAISGGTGQGLRIAKAYEIPVFNLARDGAEQKFLEFIG